LTITSAEKYDHNQTARDKNCPGDELPP